MDENVLPSKLLNTLFKAAECIRGHDFIHVFSHNDADGVSAAGILACMLNRLGKEFQVTIVPILNDGVFADMQESLGDCILMSDIGASYIDKLEEFEKDVIVLDHHRTEFEGNGIIYANPHLYGIDGMTSGCGSTLALLLAVTMDENNWDLVQIAFAGIAGDRQHIEGLKGLNSALIGEAEKRGYITRLDGSLVPPGPLSNSLFVTTDPYIRGVSGSVPAVQDLLKEARIPNDKAFKDLTEEERWKLSSLIAVKLLKQGVSVRTLEEVARTRYFLKDWNMDAESLADIMNACGRSDQGGLGVGMCLRDPVCIEAASQENRQTKNDIVEAVVNLDNRGLSSMENIQFFDNMEKGYTGLLCGIAMQYIGDPTKPTIGVGTTDDNAKVSSRANWQLIDDGLDLSIAMREAAESVGGRGGGHRIAAGGSFPKERETTFLMNLHQIVGDQLKSAR